MISEQDLRDGFTEIEEGIPEILDRLRKAIIAKDYESACTHNMELQVSLMGAMITNDFLKQ